MIEEVFEKPEKAVFKYRVLGQAMEHNYYCAVCRDKPAVIELGILQPCWGCQRIGYNLIKMNWLLRLLTK